MTCDIYDNESLLQHDPSLDLKQLMARFATFLLAYLAAILSYPFKSSVDPAPLGQ